MKTFLSWEKTRNLTDGSGRPDPSCDTPRVPPVMRPKKAQRRDDQGGKTESCARTCCIWRQKSTVLSGQFCVTRPVSDLYQSLTPSTP